MARQPGDVAPGLFPIFGSYYMQIGSSTFTNNESDTTINTSLEHVISGQISWTSSTTSATDIGAELAMESDVSSSTIAVHRQNASTNLADLTDGAFTYVIIGTLDLTD